MNLIPYSKASHSRFFLCVLFFSYTYIIYVQNIFVCTLLSSQNVNKSLLENRLKNFLLDKICFSEFSHLNFPGSVVLGKSRKKPSYFGTSFWKYPTNEGSRDPIEQCKNVDSPYLSKFPTWDQALATSPLLRIFQGVKSCWNHVSYCFTVIVYTTDAGSP